MSSVLSKPTSGFVIITSFRGQNPQVAMDGRIFESMEDARQCARNVMCHWSDSWYWSIAYLGAVKWTDRDGEVQSPMPVAELKP